MKKTLIFLIMLFSFNLYAEDLYIGEDEPVKQQEVKKPVKKKVLKKRVVKKSSRTGVKAKSSKKTATPSKAAYKKTLEEESVEVSDAPSGGKEKEEKTHANDSWWNQPEEPVKSRREFKKPEAIRPDEKDFSIKKPDFEVNRRRRVMGEHIFPTTVLFPTPVPSARFGFSQGYLTEKGKYLSIEDDGSIDKNSYNYAGMSEMFDSGIIVSKYVALDLNAQITLSGGMEKKDFLTVEATPRGDLRIGPVFSYKFDNNLLVSFAPRYYYSKGISVSASYGIAGMFNELSNLFTNPGFQELVFNATGENPAEYIYFNDVLGEVDTIEEFFEIVSSTYVSSNLSNTIKGFTKNVMINTNKTALSPSIGFAYPITEYFGVQGVLEYQKVKETIENKDKSINVSGKYNKLNYGLACSVDYRHWVKFPLGTTLEYFREKDKTETINNLAFNAYYQGIGDIQLGLTLKTMKSSHKEADYKESYSQRLIQFIITYFF